MQISMMGSPFVETQEDIEVLAIEQETSQLVVFNDEVNTFDYVIDTLMEVCKMSEMEAEQCTLIIHHKGKCTVMEGEFTRLIAPCFAIKDRGIGAEIL